MPTENGKPVTGLVIGCPVNGSNPLNGLGIELLLGLKMFPFGLKMFPFVLKLFPFGLRLFPFGLIVFPPIRGEFDDSQG